MSGTPRVEVTVTLIVKEGRHEVGANWSGGGLRNRFVTLPTTPDSRPLRETNRLKQSNRLLGTSVRQKGGTGVPFVLDETVYRSKNK